MGRVESSNGYEGVVEAFGAVRARSTIGVATVRRWAERLPSGGDVLDLGCGTGVPITRTLVDMGFALYAVDASPSMVAACRARFPHVPVECSDVPTSCKGENHYHFARKPMDGSQAS